ncbi:MAG: hypothetical protein Q9218_007025 [Villophora microphyllina]
MEPLVLYRVIYGTPSPTSFQKSLLTIRPATLHDHRRHRVRFCDYPAIIPTDVSTNTSVRGTYVRGLTDGDIFRLDTFEGWEYERRKVNIRILEKEGDEVTGEGNVEGEEVEVETYVWIAGEKHLEEGEWDFGEFRREKLGSWVDAREEYDDIDRAVEAQGKDPTGGRGANGSITEELMKQLKKQEEEIMKKAI